MCGPDVDDVIDDEVSDGDEDQILVMEEEDVDGQVHRYPGTLYLCFSCISFAQIKKTMPNMFYSLDSQVKGELLPLK